MWKGISIFIWALCWVNLSLAGETTTLSLQERILHEATQPRAKLIHENPKTGNKTTYTYQRTLGKGGLGTAILVTNPEGKPYVVRIFNPDLPESEIRSSIQAHQTYLAQQGLLKAKRSCEHLLKVHTITTVSLAPLAEHGFKVIVTELALMDLGNYLESIHQTQQRTFSEVIATLTQVTHHTLNAIAELQAVKEMRLFHGDIKPANILLIPEGLEEIQKLSLQEQISITRQQILNGQLRFVVGDFDSILRENGDSPDGYIGTPEFIPPEALLSQLTLESDFFSIGAMLYREMEIVSHPKVLKEHSHPIRDFLLEQPELAKNYPSIPRMESETDSKKRDRKLSTLIGLFSRDALQQWELNQQYQKWLQDKLQIRLNFVQNHLGIESPLYLQYRRLAQLVSASLRIKPQERREALQKLNFLEFEGSYFKRSQLR